MIHFFKKNKLLLGVILIALIERLVILFQLGFRYSINSEDILYLESGIHLMKTGELTLNGMPSTIMPALPVIIALPHTIFGSTDGLWLFLKLVMIAFSILSIIGENKIIILFSPKWIGALAALLFLTPDFIWIDNLILTDSPFMFAFVYTVYFSIMLQKTHEWKYYYLLTATYMFGLLLRSTFLIYPLILLAFLFFTNFPVKLLLKQAIITPIICLLFFIPWTLRNYLIFDHFIPTSFESASSKLLGTYQGYGFPEDTKKINKELELQLKELRTTHYKNGKYIPSYMEAYYTMKYDNLKANYRNTLWIKSNPKSMLISYGYSKPKTIMTSSFSEKKLLGINKLLIQKFKKIELIMTISLGFISMFFLKNIRKYILFMASLYIVNVYLYAIPINFQYSGQSLLFLRYTILFISIYNIYLYIKEKKRKLNK